MEHLHQVFAVVFFVLALWQCWNAYRVKFQGRTDLIRLGPGPLPGASRLGQQFAGLLLLQGVASAVAAVAFVVFGSLNPTFWVYIAVTAALSIRRELLIRGLERFATSQVNPT